MDNHWKELGKPTDILPNEYQVYQTEIGLIIVVNLDNEFYALDDICTHDGGTLSDGWLEDGQLVCPRHGARFCVKTGEALTPPAYEGVNTYPVKVESGKLYVKLN